MARLGSFVHVASPDGEQVVLGPDSELPEWALTAITNPSAWAVAPEPDEVGGTKPLTNDELEAEIARRNDGRDEADLIVPASKKKTDLVAALAADDTKSA